MNDRYSNIENQLQEFIEGQAARLLDAVPVKERLAHSFAQAMKENTREIEGAGLFGPSEYALRVHPRYFNDVITNQNLLLELAGALAAAASDNGINLQRAPSITVVPDGKIKAGEYHVFAYPVSEEQAETHAITAETQAERSPAPQKAFFILKGKSVYPLEEEVINIGRGHQNQLIIEDGRISRRHAQLRAVDGYYLLCDLESTGGTFLNGERISQAVVHPGDVISLAGVSLIYGEDAVRTLEETREYRPEADSTGMQNREESAQARS